MEHTATYGNTSRHPYGAALDANLPPAPGRGSSLSASQRLLVGCCLGHILAGPNPRELHICPYISMLTNLLIHVRAPSALRTPSPYTPHTLPNPPRTLPMPTPAGRMLLSYAEKHTHTHTHNTHTTHTHGHAHARTRARAHTHTYTKQATTAYGAAPPSTHVGRLAVVVATMCMPIVIATMTSLSTRQGGCTQLGALNPQPSALSPQP